MGLTALHLAALRGSVPCVTLLVAARAELDAAGSLAPLHLAAQHGQLEAVRMLLDLGAQKDGWRTWSLGTCRFWPRESLENLGSSESKHVGRENQLGIDIKELGNSIGEARIMGRNVRHALHIPKQQRSTLQKYHLPQKNDGFSKYGYPQLSSSI